MRQRTKKTRWHIIIAYCFFCAQQFTFTCIVTVLKADLRLLIIDPNYFFSLTMRRYISHISLLLYVLFSILNYEFICSFLNHSSLFLPLLPLWAPHFCFRFLSLFSFLLFETLLFSFILVGNAIHSAIA